MPIFSLRTLNAALFAVAAVLSAPASAIGSLADVVVIDRNSGQSLPIHTYQGRHYVAGRPAT